MLSTHIQCKVCPLHTSTTTCLPVRLLQVLCLTNPDGWSPHAWYAGTRIFASNLKPHMAQRFFNIYLLERCR